MIIKKFYGILKNETTKVEKWLFLSLVYQFACSSSLSLGYPLWFQKPLVKCKFLNKLDYEPCSLETACNGNFPYILSESSPKSLSYDYNMICENESIQRFSLFIMLSGGFLGSFVNLVILVSRQFRKKLIFICMLGFSISSIIPAIIGYIGLNTPYLVSFFFGIFQFFFMLEFTHLFGLVKERFAHDIAKISPSIYNTSWGIYGLLYALFAMIINSNWKLLMLFQGIPMLIMGLLFGFSEFDIDRSSFKASLNLRSQDITTSDHSQFEDFNIKFNFKSFKNLFKKKNDIINFFCFNYAIILILVSIVGLSTEMQSLGGNLYVNNGLSALLSSIGAFMSGILSVKGDIYSFIKKTCFIISFLLLLYFFIPQNITDFPIFIQILSSFPGILVFSFIESLNNFILIFLPCIFTKDILGAFLPCVYFLSKFATTFVPYINLVATKYFHMYSYNLYGIFYLIALFIFIFFAKIPQKGIFYYLYLIVKFFKLGNKKNTYNLNRRKRAIFYRKISRV